VVTFRAETVHWEHTEEIGSAILLWGMPLLECTIPQWQSANQLPGITILLGAGASLFCGMDNLRRLLNN